MHKPWFLLVLCLQNCKSPEDFLALIFTDGYHVLFHTWNLNEKRITVNAGYVLCIDKMFSGNAEKTFIF